MSTRLHPLAGCLQRLVLANETSLCSPKISCFYVQVVRLPFLPGSASALMAVFSAGLTFGFKPFPFFICIIFPYFYFCLFVLYFSFIFRFNFCCLVLSGPFVVSLLCLAASLSLSLIVVCSELAATHLQALELVLVVLPCPLLCFFRKFLFWTAHAIHRMHGFFSSVFFFAKIAIFDQFSSHARESLFKFSRAPDKKIFFHQLF